MNWLKAEVKCNIDKNLIECQINTKNDGCLAKHFLTYSNRETDWKWNRNNDFNTNPTITDNSDCHVDYSLFVSNREAGTKASAKITKLMHNGFEDVLFSFQEEADLKVCFPYKSKKVANSIKHH